MFSKFKPYSFNLIEIVLAIGILSVGITGILSLYSVGINQTKKSIAENYCILASRNIYSYLSALSNEGQDTWSRLYLGNAPLIPEKKIANMPFSSDTVDDWVHAFGDVYFLPEHPEGKDGVFGIISKTGRNIDFTAHVNVWSSEVPSEVIIDTDRVIPKEISTAINFEISYPVDKPYRFREKNIYYFELFNNN